MPSINSIELTGFNLRAIEDVRTVLGDSPGSDVNPITHMGYNGLVLRLDGFETTLSDYDAVIAEFMKPGDQTLIIRSGWQYSVHASQLIPEMLDGYPDTYFPYSMILYTATPYRESTLEACRGREISTNNYEWVTANIPCNDILNNWDYENWNDGTSVAPDWWVFTGVGGSVIRNSSTVKHGTYSARVSRSSSDCSLYQIISNPEHYQGKTFTFGTWIYATGTNRAAVSIQDSSGHSDVIYHSGTAGWEWITVTKNISSIANWLAVHCRVNNSSAVAYFDSAIFREGSEISNPSYYQNNSTSGTVNAMPDIQVIGGAVGTGVNRASGLRFDDTDATVHSTSSTTYVLKKTYTYPANANRTYTLDTVGLDVRSVGSSSTGWGKVTYEITGGGEVQAGEWSQYGLVWSTGNTASPGVTTALNQAVVVRFYVRHSSGSLSAEIKNCVSTISTLRKDVCKSPQIYNTDDTSIKSGVANEVEPGAIHQVNVNDTGTVKYSESFFDSKYLDAAWTHSGATLDGANNELDLASGGYIEYKFDCKHPITGIPVLTATIDINSGTPTIQVAHDDGNGLAGTYYNIDTGIVDGTTTNYELVSGTDVQFKKSTILYFKVNSASATCSIKDFVLNVADVTIDAEHPTISTGGIVNIFRCDQHTNSSMNVIVSLKYRDRSWGG